MKKAMMMLAMLAVSFAMQAQTKFHDVELNDANPGNYYDEIIRMFDADHGTDAREIVKTREEKMKSFGKTVVTFLPPLLALPAATETALAVAVGFVGATPPSVAVVSASVRATAPAFVIFFIIFLSSVSFL